MRVQIAHPVLAYLRKAALPDVHVDLEWPRVRVKELRNVCTAEETRVDEGITLLGTAFGHVDT